MKRVSALMVVASCVAASSCGLSSHASGSATTATLPVTMALSPTPSTDVGAGAAATTTAVGQGVNDTVAGGAVTPAASGYAPSPLPGVRWRPVVTLGGSAAMWAATFHPMPADPTIAVSAVVFDQSRLKAGLYNGSTQPGGGPWTNGSQVQSAAVPALVAAFNGGFLFKHIRGGYFTEGKMLKPLLAGQATLGVHTDGSLVLGVYGRDLTNDGSFVSLRQNLPPIVDGGQVALARYPGTYWGDNFHHVLDTFRSAICLRTDGKLMYVVMGKVDVGPLADELVKLGCRLAMELDINGHWPQFAWYTGFGTTQRQGVLLDARMWKPQRYLTGSEKDFCALFDAATLRAGVVA